MNTSQAAAAPGSSPASPSAPMFYRRPVPLSSQTHANWRLKGGDVTFAGETNAVPLMIGEFAAAARSYPIVFGATDTAPIALLGLQRTNLFVANGKWSEGHYIPAYVRRYPFVFIQLSNPDGFALAIDADSGRVVSEGRDGVALFQDGAPADVTKQALEFCRLFTGEHRATRAFAEALRANGLMTARHADIALPTGRKLSLSGFEIVDAEKFATLPDNLVVDWHRKGWLGLVSLHLASLGRFTDLLSLQTARESAAGAPTN